MKKQKKQPAVRCAIYTRKSTNEGLDQEFNSLDAQREAAEAYIVSQQSCGWKCVPERYDDGGFTGANIDRPALARLLADIEDGKVDVVVVYKVDRLSRSLLDFARMMETFQRFEVSFVSVTQHFNTATSMGRLILNILLSFAQFEREMISERTRDKMAAARRKGKWLGGVPVLGYDVDRQARRLIVNQKEAKQVQETFELYLQLGGLIPVVEELARRGWVNKRWTNRKNVVRHGKPFNKGTLHYLLTNVTYRGLVKFEGEIYPGDHPAIVSEELFQQVQALLAKNRRLKKRPKASDCKGALEGLLYCAACESRMFHTYTNKGNRRYRYYLCSSAQKRGHNACPSKSIPALEIERFVIGEVQKTIQAATDTRLPAESYSMAQQAKALTQLVDRIDYNGRTGDLHIKLAQQNTKNRNDRKPDNSSSHLLSDEGPSPDHLPRTARKSASPVQ